MVSVLEIVSERSIREALKPTEYMEAPSLQGSSDTEGLYMSSDGAGDVAGAVASAKLICFPSGGSMPGNGWSVAATGDI